MAIAITQLVGTSTAGAYATSVSTAPWTPAADKLLIARAYAYQSGNPAGSLSLVGNGLTWIRLADDNLVGTFRVAVFCAWSSSATAGVTTLTSTTSDQLELRVFEASGAKLGESGFSAIRQCVVGHALTGTGLTFDLPLAPLAANHLILALCDTDSTVSFSPEASWSELYDTGHAAAVYRADTSDGSITFTSSGSCAKIAVALELYADTAAPEIIVRPFGSASNPVGGYATLWENSTTPVVVTPPVGMLDGDLVVMVGATRDTTGVSMAISAAGGQTWTALSPLIQDTSDSTYPASAQLFWCRFNGTWGADPSIAITGGTAPHSAAMRVYRPPATATTWAVHQALTETDFAAGVNPRTITGQATTVDLAVQLALAATSITAGDLLMSVSGSGWAPRGSVLNTYGSDLAIHLADRVVVGASSAVNVSLTYYGGGGADTSGIITFAAQIVVGSMGATAAITLDAITLSSAGEAANAGSLSATLDAFTLEGIGAEGAFGTLAATLDAFTLQSYTAVGDFGVPSGEANPCDAPGDDLGKIEGRYTVPAAGLRMTVNYNGGGEATIGVLSGGATYWPTAWSSDSNTFAGTIPAVLNLWLGGDIEITIDDDGTDPTGRVTISATDTFTVAWPDPELAELLGFDPANNLTGANTYTGENACQNVWLPDRRRWLPPDPEGSVGRPVPNTSMLISPSGHSVVLDFGSRYATSIEFHFISGNRARKELEVITNESWQSFFENVVAKGEPIRYHYDRSDNFRHVTWRMMPVFLVAPDVAGWTGIGCTGAEAYYGIGPVDVIEWKAP